MKINKEIVDSFNEYASSLLGEKVEALWFNDKGRLMPKLTNLAERGKQPYADLLMFYEDLLKPVTNN